MTVNRQPPLDLLRLSLSESQHGPSPRVLAALLRELSTVHLYPPSDNEPVASILAARWSLAPSNVVIGNGADELLLLTALALRNVGSRAGYCERTFAGHSLSIKVAGYTTLEIPLDEGGLHVERLIAATERCDVLYVCNPHNPTGSALNRAELAELVSAADNRCTLVVDEVYNDFAEPDFCGSAIPYVRAGANVAVIRSFSKTHNLAGLRCGYLLAPEQITASFSQLTAMLPFRVNRLALAAAEATLSEPDHLEATLAEIRAERTALTQALRARAMEPLPSQTNFVLARVPGSAGDFVTTLRKLHSIEVRDATSLGFSERVRIGVPLSSELTRLLDGIDDSLGRIQ